MREPPPGGTIDPNRSLQETSMASTRIGASARPTWAASLALILGLAACSPAADGPAQPSATGSVPVATPSASASVAPSESATGAAIEEIAAATLAVEYGPDFPAEGFGSLWVLAPDRDSPAMVRVDPATNQEIARVPLPGRACQGFAVGPDAVWACAIDGAVRIDPQTNTVVSTVAYEGAAVFGRLAVGAGSVWAIGTDGFGPNTLMRIDMATESVTPIPLGHIVGTIAFGFDAIWATAPADGLLLRVDPGTGEVTELTRGLPGPWNLSVGPDSIWLTLHGNDGDRPAPGAPTIARVDPADGSIVAEIAADAPSGRLGGVWATADAVWVRAPDAFLTEIDPATNEIVQSIAGPPSSGDVTVAFGSVWATDVERHTVYRFEP